jgi:TolB-like protein/cytochrome c-type biogenesis protein CcmH/NrfG
LIVVGLAVGLAAWLAGWLASDRPAMQPGDESAVAALPFTDRPAIAVLAFKNMSDDPDDAYFVYGLTEDLTDRLASWRQFPVIGTLSSRSYEDQSIDPLKVATELGARYLVRGSVRRSDETLRINVQLYDAVSGQQIWSERYDRPTGDVLAVQDEIGTAIVAEMYPQLEQFDQRRAMSRHPDDMTAWDLAQKGWWHFTRESRTDNELARASYQQAVERDPNYSNAAAGLALAHYQSVAGGWADEPEQSIDLLVEWAERSVGLDSLAPLNQHALGHAYALNGNRQGMIQAFNTSLELNPSNALVAICAGEGFAMAGESEAAIEALESAMRLSPRDPFAFWTYHALAMAHFAEGRNEEAIVWARQSLAHNPAFAFGYRTLATVLATDGQLDAAREALARATKIEPEFTYASGRRVMRTGSPEFAERYMSGLRLAGFE